MYKYILMLLFVFFSSCVAVALVAGLAALKEEMRRENEAFSRKMEEVAEDMDKIAHGDTVRRVLAAPAGAETETPQPPGPGEEVEKADFVD